MTDFQRPRRGRPPGIRSQRAAGVEGEEAVVRTVAQRAISQRRRERNLSMPKGKLNARELPGFHLCWVDEPKLHEFLDADYEHVLASDYGVAEQSDSTDTTIKRVHGRNEGGGVFSYLMKIKLELWEEDQAIHQEYCDKVDEAILGGDAVGAEGQTSKRGNRTYTPSGGVSMEHMSHA